MRKPLRQLFLVSITAWAIVGGSGVAHAATDVAPPNLQLAETFTHIWSSNFWEHRVSRSGPGSALEATQHVREGIEQLIADYDIETVVDVACGDFGWMHEVDLQGARYTGLDIVGDLIEEVKQTYGAQHPEHVFAVADMTTDKLPQGDLVLARDVLGHLSYENGLRALANIRASGAKWLLTTTFVGSRSNKDILDGQWRPVDLSRPPYSLGAPIAVIIEHCREHNGAFADKALGLWPVTRLPRAAEFDSAD